MIEGKINPETADHNVYINNIWLTPKTSQAIVNHSPDGFSWGYAGSGPSQLALALLIYFTDDDYALKHYQDFKTDVVMHLPNGQGFKIKNSVVTDWVAEHAS
jgi:hypothetical protein